MASISSLWFSEAVSREAFNSSIFFSRLVISSSFSLIISSEGVPRALIIVSGSFLLTSPSLLNRGAGFAFDHMSFTKTRPISSKVAVNLEVLTFGNFLLISSQASSRFSSFVIRGVCSSIPSIKDVSP